MLGDEMGLGKSVEALAAMCHLHVEGHWHFLVVCRYVEANPRRARGGAPRGGPDPPRAFCPMGLL